MGLQVIRRSVLPVLGAGVLFCYSLPAVAADAAHRVERQFTIKGRTEVKSTKNPQVIVSASRASDKVAVDIEQVGDRVDVTAIVLDASAQPSELESNFLITVPEEAELQLKTQTGLIYVEQVMGDMTLQSVAGDVHLKEVSGYIVVRTTGGSLVCTQCAGKLEFHSISGNAQVIQPALSNVTLMT